jgi:thiol:disulfide interchange protein
MKFLYGPILKLLYALIVWSTCAYAQPKTQWMDLPTAMAKAKTNKQFVLLKLWADWCGPCHIMEKYTFGDPEIIQLVNTHFYPVKLNVESSEQIMCNNWPKPVQECAMRVWGLQGVPAIVILGPDGNNILQVVQYMDVPVMKEFLENLIANKPLLLQADAELTAERKRKLQTKGNNK